MNNLQRLGHWGETHHPHWMDIVRIVLGIFLCYKGVVFLSDTSVVMKQLTDNMSFGSLVLVLLSHYITFVHLLGGFLIAVGLLTRIACLAQIPILLGAIIFINAPEGLWQPFSEMWLAILVLLLLTYFSLAGDGRWSFNWFIDHAKEK